jgi:ADP-heptose:LPS heptosyltransferase
MLLGLLATALRAVRAASPAHAESRKVMVLEPFGIGDMISYQPLIQSLRENGYDVRVCARPAWQSLYPEVEHWVPSRVPWSSYEETQKYRFTQFRSAEFREFLRQLRKWSAGAIGIDTRGDIRSVLLLYWAGCREVLTLSNYLGSDLLNFSGAARRVPFSQNSRRWELNLSFLQALGLQPRGQPPEFPHLKRLGLSVSGRQLGLVPVAPWNGKLWGRSNWTEFLASATKSGWSSTALCGPGQMSAVSSELGGQVQIVECSSIEAWAVELQRFSAIVTVDTGPMHLADALGVPMVALFGQGLLPLWAPSGRLSWVVSHQDDPDFRVCHPVEENTVLGREFMRRIRPGEVLDALRQLEEMAPTRCGTVSD